MKRAKKSIGTIINELNSEGYTNKEIYTKLGIKERTFYSYKRYFNVDLINKNSREPDQEVKNKIKEFARNRGIRSTIDVDPDEDYLIYVKTFYTVQNEDNLKELRNMVIPTSKFAWDAVKDKETYIQNYIRQRFKDTKGSSFQNFQLDFYDTVLEDEL